jgi:hypothetical protein
MLSAEMISGRVDYQLEASMARDYRTVQLLFFLRSLPRTGTMCMPTALDKERNTC